MYVTALGTGGGAHPELRVACWLHIVMQLPPLLHTIRSVVLRLVASMLPWGSSAVGAQSGWHPTSQVEYPPRPGQYRRFGGSRAYQCIQDVL